MQPSTTSTARLRERLAAHPRRRIIVGAEGTSDAGWISTEAGVLNLLAPSDWSSFFDADSIEAILAEHVWEHLTIDEGVIAAETCFRFLKPGGYLRVAVPDGLHPNVDYIEWVKVGGKGPGADDHKVLYTYKTLRASFERAGFTVILYEYFDEEGHFHYQDWDPRDGMIRRSRKYDKRNQNGALNYTSIMLDAFKRDDQETREPESPEANGTVPLFARTALPNFGPLAPTEDTLHVLDSLPGIKALEIGCGNGYSLRYLARNGASEVWGLDKSVAQISDAEQVLQEYRASTHLFHAPMETNPGIPTSYFDLALSIYALGYTTDLRRTLGLINGYLKPGGCLIVSDEHPVYSCLALKDEQLIFQEPYTLEESYQKELGDGTSALVKKRTMSSIVNCIIEAGLRIERLIEGEINYDLAQKKHYDAKKWYSVQRAQLMPTTFIVKARRPYNTR